MIQTLLHFIKPFLNLWIFIGFFGQFVFFMRFIVQWYASEKAKKVVIPIAFWYLSMAGTVIIFVYSVYRRDIVFSTAQVLSMGIYFRNLALLKKHPEEVNSADA